jgi:hypothetical protein
MGLYLFFRKRFVSEPEAQTSTTSSEKGRLEGPPIAADYAGGINITGPIGDNYTTDLSQEVRPGYQNYQQVSESWKDIP